MGKERAKGQFIMACANARFCTKKCSTCPIASVFCQYTVLFGVCWSLVCWLLVWVWCVYISAFIVVFHEHNYSKFLVWPICNQHKKVVAK